jgi:hypothetical protein
MHVFISILVIPKQRGCTGCIVSGLSSLPCIPIPVLFLNEKYFQRVEQSLIEIQGKKAMSCPQRCKLSKYVFMILTFSLWPWNSNRVCCYYTTTNIIFSTVRKLVAYSWLVSYSLFITYSLFAIPNFIWTLLSLWWHYHDRWQRQNVTMSMTSEFKN